MTIPNSLNKVNRKIISFWNETDNNKTKINIQTENQGHIDTELDRSIISNNSFQNIEYIDFGFEDFTVFESNNSDIPITIYKKWEIVVKGLKLIDTPSVRHNFIYKFGSGKPLLDYNIQSDANVLTNDYIKVEETEDTGEDITFNYGVYIGDFGGIEEISEYGMRVKLKLSIMNPNYYV
jgi:hypothetical protein